VLTSLNRLSGFVHPAKRQGKPVRGLWELWVCLPPEPAQGKDGLPLLDKRGRPKMRYPKTMKCVDAPGKKAAERLLEAWIRELEQHEAVDLEKLTLVGLLDRWLEVAWGEMRVATRNSYKSIRRLHVDPALGGVLAAGLTRTQLSAYYSAKMRGNGKPPLAETTVAHHHSMIKAAFNWTIDEEQLAANPAQRVKNPPALRPRVRPVWSMEEIAHVVVRARGLQVHAAGVLAALSGPRAWEDEDKTVIE